MPNFNNWRNWGTNILIRLGLQDQHYAHAFATVDPVYEPEEEEVDLGATVFAWGWFKKITRSVAKVFKPVTKVVKAVYKPIQKATRPLDKAINVVKQPVQKAVKAVGSYDYKKKASNIAKDIGRTADKVGANIKRGVKDVATDPGRVAQNILTLGETERERTKARAAFNEATDEHKKAVAAYHAQKASDDKLLAESRAKYAKQKEIGAASEKAAQAKLAQARVTRTQTEREGARSVARIRSLERNRQQRIASETIARGQQEAVARRKAKNKKVGLGPRGGGGTATKKTGLGGYGRVGSETRSAKRLRDRDKGSINVG